MKKTILVSTMLCILMLMPSVAQATLTDDGYHFEDYKDWPNVGNYGEWWYFNFYQSDIQGVIQYSLWDPTNLTETHYGLMYVSMFWNGTVTSIYFPIPWQYIVTSETSADLIMGPNTISVYDGVYGLEGYVLDLEGNTIAWNLQYMQSSPSLDGFRNFEVYANEELNWYAQMPSAMVYGVIILNGVPIPVVGANGYHDHNWGVWELYHGLWNWFQTSDNGLAIVGYDFYTMNEGAISVLLDQEEITFEKDQYRLINCRWKFNLETLQFYPTKTIIIAFNGDYLLFLQINVEQTDLIARAYIEESILWIVFESTAHFRGFLFGEGTHKRINSTGYKEYVINTILPPI